MISIQGCTTALLFLLILLEPAMSQFGGSRAGVQNSEDASLSICGPLPLLKPDVAEAFVTVEGSAELRVRPTQIRVVLAVTSQTETAQACRQEIDEKIKLLRAEWKKLGIGDDKVVEDFIAVLPRYEWQQDNRDGHDVMIERKIGFQMQSNLHVAVANDRAAQLTIDRAFDVGVTDIIAFDYGSDELDAAKERARATALKTAKSKAELLLSGMFKGEPTIINVQEQTTVRYPESLYKSFTNAADQEITSSWRNNVPHVHAHRPKNTYYRGLIQNGDIQPRELPMHSEITVVSTVRLYFASPAFGQRNPAKSDVDTETK